MNYVIIWVIYFYITTYFLNTPSISIIDSPVLNPAHTKWARGFQAALCVNCNVIFKLNSSILSSYFHLESCIFNKKEHNSSMPNLNQENLGVASHRRHVTNVRLTTVNNQSRTGKPDENKAAHRAVGPHEQSRPALVDISSVHSNNAIENINLTQQRPKTVSA